MCYPFALTNMSASTSSLVKAAWELYGAQTALRLALVAKMHDLISEVLLCWLHPVWFVSDVVVKLLYCCARVSGAAFAK